jgi:hypothetical protein
MFCLLPHPFDYAAQPLARGQVLPEITHFSFPSSASTRKRSSFILAAVLRGIARAFALKRIILPYLVTRALGGILLATDPNGQMQHEVLVSGPVVQAKWAKSLTFGRCRTIWLVSKCLSVLGYAKNRTLEAVGSIPISSTIWSSNPLESVAFFGDLPRSGFVPFFAARFVASMSPQFWFPGGGSSPQYLFGGRALRPHALGGRGGLAMAGEIHDTGQVTGHLPKVGETRVTEVVVRDAVRSIVIDAGRARPLATASENRARRR